MTDEDFETFSEIVAFSGTPSELHPLKLDRWWRTVVGAPDLIYFQMGFHTIFDQVDRGALAIKTFLDLVGRSSLPLSPQIISQRHIGQFSFHVPGGSEGTYKFSASWDKSVVMWSITTGEAEVKWVSSLEEAVEKAMCWHSTELPVA